MRWIEKIRKSDWFTDIVLIVALLGSAFLLMFFELLLKK